MSRFRQCFVIALTCIIFCVPVAGHTAGLPPLPAPPAVPKLPSVPSLPIPDVTQLLNGEPITTSLSDAVTAIPFLNDYQPGLARNLASIQPDSRGAFKLVAGSYWFEGRSYCLHAGRHAPSSGASYLLAPLKGPRAPIIQDILRNSVAHLEVPQQNVQQLIWAVLARAKFGDLPANLQLAAAKLLSPAEIVELNTSAVGIVPADKLNALLAKVPDPMKPVLDAENSLRGMLTSNATYQDMERVAVLPSLPETATVQAQNELRWSYDPHGFFVWYTPHGYQSTTTFVDVPGAVTEQRDQLGRISTLRDNQGNTLTATYANTGVTVDGDAQTQFYRLQSVQFVWHNVGIQGTTQHTVTWPASELVLVGVPNGKGKVNGSGAPADAQALYDSASTLAGQFSDLLRQIHGQADTLPELMALASFRTSLASVAKAHTKNDGGVNQALNFPVGAWESALARSTGGKVAADVRAGVDDPFDPSNNAGVPQNSGAQRLAQSGLPTGGPGGSTSNTPPNCPKQNVKTPFDFYGRHITDMNHIGMTNCSQYGFNWSVNYGSNGNSLPQNSQNPYQSFNGLTVQRSDGSFQTTVTVTTNGRNGITINQTNNGGSSGSAIVSIIDALQPFFPHH